MKNIKKITILIFLAIAIVAFLPTISCASLQSRPETASLVSTTASQFFLLSRQMETSAGPMGLSATIEVVSNKVQETSTSNNIDVHMIKNTEYGTAAMLAASVYGNCPTGSSPTLDSTTRK